MGNENSALQKMFDVLLYESILLTRGKVKKRKERKIYLHFFTSPGDLEIVLGIFPHCDA